MNRYGLVPESAEGGDLICQFFESDIAVLLRRTRPGNLLRLVGRMVIMPTEYSPDKRTPSFGMLHNVLRGDIPQRPKPGLLGKSKPNRYLDMKMDMLTIQELTRPWKDIEIRDK
jgi:hypothetical protein